MDLFTDFTDLSKIVASFRDHAEKVHDEITAHDADVARAAKPMTDTLRLFLATVPTNTTIVKLPEELAGLIAEVWAAEYVVWKKPSVANAWKQLADYVDDLVTDMGWGVFDRETADPHPQSVGHPVWITLLRQQRA